MSSVYLSDLVTRVDFIICSGLGASDFMKRTTFLETPEAAFAKIADSAATLADFEGLPAHGLSVRVRQS
jgi:histidinol dehydrogenase